MVVVYGTVVSYPRVMYRHFIYSIRERRRLRVRTTVALRSQTKLKPGLKNGFRSNPLRNIVPNTYRDVGLKNRV